LSVDLYVITKNNKSFAIKTQNQVDRVTGLVFIFDFFHANDRQASVLAFFPEKERFIG